MAKNVSTHDPVVPLRISKYTAKTTLITQYYTHLLLTYTAA